jgi:hypothetical protein
MNWIVEDHIVDGTLTCVFGEGSSFKSFVALDIALAVAAGSPLYGRYPTTKMPVVFVEGYNMHSVRHRLEYRSVMSADRNLLFVDGCDFEKIEERESLVQQLKDFGGLIVVDCMLPCAPADIDEVAGMAAALDMFREVQRQTGSTVLLVHGFADWPGSGYLRCSVPCINVERIDNYEAEISTGSVKYRLDAERVGDEGDSTLLFSIEESAFT